MAKSSLAPGVAGVLEGSSELFELCFEVLALGEGRLLPCGKQFLEGIGLFLLSALFFFDGVGLACFPFDNGSTGGSRGSTGRWTTPTSFYTGLASALLSGGVFWGHSLGKLAAAGSADHSGGPIVCVRALWAFHLFGGSFGPVLDRLQVWVLAFRGERELPFP